MIRLVDISEAEAQLAELVEDVLVGKEVIISKAGEPVVKLVPFEDTSPRELGGSWEGQVWLADDFDELPEKLARAFGMIE